MNKYILSIVLSLTGCSTHNQVEFNKTSTIPLKVYHYEVETYIKTYQKELNKKNDNILGKVEKKYLKLLYKNSINKDEYFHKKVFHIDTTLTDIRMLDNHPNFRDIYPSSTDISIIYYKDKAIINYFYKDPCYPGSKDSSFIGGNDLIILSSKHILTKYTLGGYCAYGCPVSPIVP